MYNTKSGDSYVAPEVVELGAAGQLTLGQINLAYPDGCNCSKSSADAELEVLGC